MTWRMWDLAGRTVMRSSRGEACVQGLGAHDSWLQLLSIGYDIRDWSRAILISCRTYGAARFSARLPALDWEDCAGRNLGKLEKQEWTS